MQRGGCLITVCTPRALHAKWADITLGVALRRWGRVCHVEHPIQENIGWPPHLPFTRARSSHSRFVPQGSICHCMAPPTLAIAFPAPRLPLGSSTVLSLATTRRVILNFRRLRCATQETSCRVIRKRPLDHANPAQSCPPLGCTTVLSPVTTHHARHNFRASSYALPDREQRDTTLHLLERALRARVPPPATTTWPTRTSTAAQQRRARTRPASSGSL